MESIAAEGIRDPFLMQYTDSVSSTGRRKERSLMEDRNRAQGADRSSPMPRSDIVRELSQISNELERELCLSVTRPLDPTLVEARLMDLWNRVELLRQKLDN